ncbi:hypothetical protein CRUP_026728 [Coryphaenoides rupestris]|nr:hypothetical protein CRUP_026728 [Coryphaenoides rupestris]
MLVKQEAELEGPDHTYPTFLTQEESAALPLVNTHQSASQSAQELQECGRGFSETPADPKTSEEPCTTIAVQVGALDTNTAAMDSSSHQPRRAGSEGVASDCSVLDLEAFFTRWTPDSGPPPAPPSCSFSTEDLLVEEEEEEEVVLVEEHHQPPRRRGGAQRSSTIHTNHTPCPGTSLSASPRIQAPPPQLTWSRAAAMMRTAQTQSLQHGRHGNRIAHHGLHAPQNPLSATANAGHGDVGTRNHCSANFPGFPPADLSRGSKTQTGHGPLEATPPVSSLEATLGLLPTRPHTPHTAASLATPAPYSRVWFGRAAEGGAAAARSKEAAKAAISCAAPPPGRPWWEGHPDSPRLRPGRRTCRGRVAESEVPSPQLSHGECGSQVADPLLHPGQVQPRLSPLRAGLLRTGLLRPPPPAAHFRWLDSAPGRPPPPASWRCLRLRPHPGQSSPVGLTLAAGLGGPPLAPACQVHGVPWRAGGRISGATSRGLRRPTGDPRGPASSAVCSTKAATGRESQTTTTQTQKHHYQLRARS